MSNSSLLPLSPGDYCICLIGDEYWPVVVIDDMMAAEFSPDPRPGVDAIPVLATGSKAVHWADTDQLMDLFDPREEMRRDPNCNSMRLGAFEMALQFKPLDYWRGILSSQRDKDLAYGLQRTPTQADEDVTPSTKRPSTSSSGQLPTPPSPSPALDYGANPNASKRSRTTNLEYTNLIEGDEENDFTFTSASKKKRKSSMPPSLATTKLSQTKDLYDLALEAEKNTSLLTQKHHSSSGSCHTDTPQTSSSQHNQDQFQIKIYVSRGDKEKLFALPPHRASPELLELLNWDNEEGIHYRLEQTDPGHFKKIEDYLIHGDWEPSIVNDPTWPIPRLSKVILSNQTRQDCIEDCSFVWVTAKKLRLAALRRLVLDKLKLLAPYTHLGMLILAKAVYEVKCFENRGGEDAEIEDSLDQDMKELLVDYIAENYEAMEQSVQQRSNLQAVMTDDVHLSVAVADRMEEMGGQNPDEDDDEDGDANEDAVEDEDGDSRDDWGEFANQGQAEVLMGSRMNGNEDGEISAFGENLDEALFEEENEDLGDWMIEDT